ncbi:MAG: hypothetical protein LBH32_02760 [Dysgonamonadaceae bacterium]|jgi:hypothetical protein|nr:hypothetical protein [Dysgonamonadaceae bacterium]
MSVNNLEVCFKQQEETPEGFINEDDMDMKWEKFAEKIRSFLNLEEVDKDKLSNIEGKLSNCMTTTDHEKLIDLITSLNEKVDSLTNRLVSLESQQQSINVDKSLAYEDAVNTFINLNDRIFNLRRYSEAITELFQYLSLQKESVNKSVISNGVIEDKDKEKLHILLGDIESFINNQVSVINNYLANNPCYYETYKDCIRFPLNQHFSKKYDSNIGGDDNIDGKNIKKVNKLGYHFPKSRSGAYIEKSIVTIFDN